MQGLGATNVMSIRDFGAVADRATLATRAIQAAVDAAHAAGGGVVYCPPGDYPTGSIELKSNVNLHAEAGATLWGSTRESDYDQSVKIPVAGGRHAQFNRSHLVFARGADNVAITGRGTIDGQGDSFFAPPEPGTRRMGRRGWRP